MSDLQPSPDLEALFDRLDASQDGNWYWSGFSPDDDGGGIALEVKPIISEWTKQHDEELAALREENARLHQKLAAFRMPASQVEVMTLKVENERLRAILQRQSDERLIHDTPMSGSID